MTRLIRLPQFFEVLKNFYVVFQSHLHDTEIFLLKHICNGFLSPLFDVGFDIVVEFVIVVVFSFLAVIDEAVVTLRLADHVLFTFFFLVAFARLHLAFICLFIEEVIDHLAFFFVAVIVV